MLSVAFARESRSYCRNILKHEFALLFEICFFALGSIVGRHLDEFRPSSVTRDKRNEVKELLPTITVQCLLCTRTWMGCLDRAALPPRLNPPPLFLARFASFFLFFATTSRCVFPSAESHRTSKSTIFMFRVFLRYFYDAQRILQFGLL